MPELQTSGGSLREVAILRGHDDRVWAVAFHHDGTLLASCSGDKTVRLWRRNAPDQWVFEAELDDVHQRTIRSVAFSPSGQFLATASFDAQVAVWTKQGGEWTCMTQLEGHENEVKSVAWSPSGTLLATCSRDKSVWIWELDGDDFECAAVLQEHTQDVKFVAWHPSEDLLISCSYDDTVKVWRSDLDDWFCVDTLQAHTSTVWSAAFSPDGNRLATASDDKKVCIWQRYKAGLAPPEVELNGKPERWVLVQTLEGHHSRTVYSVAWSADNVLATGGADDAVIVYRADAAGKFSQVAHRAKAHSSDVNCVAWSPSDPSLLVSAGDDTFIRLWRVDA